MGIARSCTTALALLALLAAAAQTPDSVLDRAQQLMDRASAAAKRADGGADALASYREALELWRSAGDRSHEGHTLIAIGRLEALSGNKAQARDTFSQAVTLFQELDDVAGESDARYGLARQQADLHDTQGAIASYEKTIDL
jgi:tetratricopeptide (TPR) repeat protein